MRGFRHDGVLGFQVGLCVREREHAVVASLEVLSDCLSFSLAYVPVCGLSLPFSISQSRPVAALPQKLGSDVQQGCSGSAGQSDDYDKIKINVIQNDRRISFGYC